MSNPQIDETILRTVGMLSITSDQTAAAEHQLGALGMIIVSTTAFAAGIASISNPFSDVNDDGWFLYVPFAQDTGLVTAPLSKEYSFDSRAKRKVEDGSTAVIVLANSHATEGLDFAIVMRLLSMVTGT